MDDYKRREFIKLSALGFASVALQLNAISSYAQKSNGFLGRWDADTVMNWDAFLERLTQLAISQHQQPWDQVLYTQQVKKLLLKCNFPEFENVRKEIEAYENKRENWFESASLHYEVDFQVSLFQFEKGEYIPHHDHPDMTGVINVVSGGITAKNYDFLKQLSETREIVNNGKSTIMQKCTIKEVGNERLQGGSVGILTAHDGNIHSIMPNEFTQLVDVFTPSYKHDTKANWYTVNEEGFFQDQENVFEAEYLLADRTSIKTIELNRRRLKRFEGNYLFDNGEKVEFFLRDDVLVFRKFEDNGEPGEESVLLPYEENKFWREDMKVRFEFDTTSSRRAESVTFVVFGEHKIARRIL